ncbi:MAG: type II secretion system protein E [Geobacteraceae bacterium GWC2_58_44]|nr:MAG: type II secretion system protein E [Geobacteraceae bacterium GWC2_58_44]HBG05968.1 type II secretion system protein E [Geobacter sp.]
MDNQLIIHLKSDDRIEGRLARSFKNNDVDVELFVHGEERKFLFKLDEICYIRFLHPPAALSAGEPASLEQIQTITGETFSVAVFSRPQFLKGFIGLLQDGDGPYRTIFFTSTGVRYRQDDSVTLELFRDNVTLADDHIEDVVVLTTPEELVTAGLDQVKQIGQTLQGASEGAGNRQNARVGDILVEAGLVTRDEVEAALYEIPVEAGPNEHAEPESEQHPARRKLKVGELLVTKGLITEEQLICALATKFRLRFVDLHGITPSEAALAAIPQGLASRLQVFPVSLTGRRLVVATSTPTDLTTEDILRFSTNCSIELVVSSSRQIAAAIERYYSHRGEAVDTLLESMKGEAETLSVEEEADEARLLFEPDSEVISLVNRLLIDAYKRGASDIHFEPGSGQSPLIVRYRIDGECVPAHQIAASYKWAIIARIKILALLDIAERRRPQSGKILLRYHQQKLEYRVEITPLVGGREAAVLRLLVASKPLPLSQLALMPYNLERFLGLLQKPYGIILCVGPTGAGKTTTLHSALGHINSRERKIWTAEDPVEITQAGLCQVQINVKIGFTFAEALRSFLRADPDVIMIGEMRDPETAKIAIEASLTGHLVLSTLHTNSAPETAVRLIEMGMDPFNFADALIGILAQRLAKRLCEHCRKKVSAKRELYDQLVADFDRSAGRRLEVLPAFDDAKLMEKCGCERCGGSGYKGRVAIHELMTAIPAIKKAIRHEARVEELREIALQEGMWTLKMDGIMKVLTGDTDMEQILRVCM